MAPSKCIDWKVLFFKIIFTFLNVFYIISMKSSLSSAMGISWKVRCLHSLRQWCHTMSQLTPQYYLKYPNSNPGYEVPSREAMGTIFTVMAAKLVMVTKLVTFPQSCVLDLPTHLSLWVRLLSPTLTTSGRKWTSQRLPVARSANRPALLVVMVTVRRPPLPASRPCPLPRSLSGPACRRFSWF